MKLPDTYYPPTETHLGLLHHAKATSLDVEWFKLKQRHQMPCAWLHSGYKPIKVLDKFFLFGNMLFIEVVIWLKKIWELCKNNRDTAWSLRLWFASFINENAINWWEQTTFNLGTCCQLMPLLTSLRCGLGHAPGATHAQTEVLTGLGPLRYIHHANLLSSER